MDLDVPRLPPLPTAIDRLFGRTRREVSALPEPIGQTWLRRAGYLRREPGQPPLWLPLGQAVLQRLRRLCLAALPEAQFLAVSPSADEVSWLREVCGEQIRSYRQLPQTLAWNPSPDSLAVAWLAPGPPDLSAIALTTWQRWRADWEALNVPLIEITAVGNSEAPARAVALPCDGGPDEWLLCVACNRASEPGAMRPRIAAPSAEPPLPIEEVATPDCQTIQAVADFLGVATQQTLKAVFYATAERQIVFAVIRGDLEVDADKLARVVGQPLHPATPDELEAAGIVVGFASPVGLAARARARVIGDLSIQAEVNFVAGANRPGYHLRHVRYPRDFAVEHLADLALARPGAPCPACGAPLAAADGLIWARLVEPSPVDGAPSYLDARGRPQPVTIAVAHVDLGRLHVAIAEANHDARGLCLPASLAPYHVHVIVLNGDQEPVRAAIAEMADLLAALGWTALWDERGESAGVKFADADLIGLPWRITISPRSLQQGGVEVKARRASAARTVALSREALPAALTREAFP